jgi:hypothetical protein
VIVMTENPSADRLLRRAGIVGGAVAMAGAALTASVIAGVTHSAAATQTGSTSVTSTTTTPANSSTSSADNGTTGITTAPQQSTAVGGSNGS